MAGRGDKWSREETLAALFLYLALPSKMVDDTSEDVQALAKAIGRTPGAVALKSGILHLSMSGDVLAARLE